MLLTYKSTIWNLSCNHAVLHDGISWKLLDAATVKGQPCRIATKFHHAICIRFNGDLEGQAGLPEWERTIVIDSLFPFLCLRFFVLAASDTHYMGNIS